MKKKINGYNVSHIDNDTGEIICQTTGCTEIKDNELTDKEKKRQEYLDTHDITFGQGVGFVKLYTEVVWKMAQKLSPKEFTIAISICKFVDYETCAIRNGYGKGRHDVDLHELSEELEMEYSGLCRVIRSLIGKGVVGEFRVGGLDGKLTKKYYVNPYIYTNGANPEFETLNNFSKTGWEEFIYS